MKQLNFISKNDLAKSLGISLSTIDRKLNELPTIKLGNARQSRVIFPLDEVNKYLERHSVRIKKEAT
jgi:predicted DNA-binding transcriptional regulator AlpA